MTDWGLLLRRVRRHTPADSSQLVGLWEVRFLRTTECIPAVGSRALQWSRVWLRGMNPSAAKCQRAIPLGGVNPCSASVGESRRAVKLDRKLCSLPWGKSVTLFLGSREAAFESCREFKVDVRQSSGDNKVEVPRFGKSKHILWPLSGHIQFKKVFGF